MRCTSQNCCVMKHLTVFEASLFASEQIQNVSFLRKFLCLPWSDAWFYKVFLFRRLNYILSIFIFNESPANDNAKLKGIIWFIKGWNSFTDFFVHGLFNLSNPHISGKWKWEFYYSETQFYWLKKIVDLQKDANQYIF